MTLEGLFRPRSVAVFGSASPDKHGYTVVRNLVRWRFPGQILPINREATPIEGCAGYRSLADAPVVPDCAMLVIPAANCVAAIRECAAAGVRFAVIGASGFAELATEAGAARQREIEAIAVSSGLRVVGPNTNGIYNATDRFSLGYNAAHGEVRAAGDVSVISHSGALFDGIARRLELAGAGLSKFVPVGNEADLTMLDFLAYLIDDPATRVIGLVIEGIGDGARFRELAARAQAAGKLIVALKIGRSAAGASAALAHSSRLAGAARAYDALLLAARVASVRTVEGLAAGCAVLSAQHGAAATDDDAIVVVTTSGAGGALVADVAADRGWLIAGSGGEWPDAVAAGLRALGTAARIRNPIDLGTLGDWKLLSNVFAELRSHADGPVIVYAHNAPQERMADELAAALIERKTHTSCAGRGPRTGRTAGRYRDAAARTRHSGVPRHGRVFRGAALLVRNSPADATRRCRASRRTTRPPTLHCRRRRARSCCAATAFRSCSAARSDRPTRRRPRPRRPGTRWSSRRSHPVSPTSTLMAWSRSASRRTARCARPIRRWKRALRRPASPAARCRSSCSRCWPANSNCWPAPVGNRRSATFSSTVSAACMRKRSTR